MTDPVVDPAPAAAPAAASPQAEKKPVPSTLLGRRTRAALVWWANLQDGSPFADRRARAVLRRCDPESAIEEESVFALYRALVRATPAPQADGTVAPPEPPTAREKRRLLVLSLRLALVLAHVRENDVRNPLARKVGKSEAKADDAKLSSARLRTLLEARTPDEIVRGFRRAVALAGDAVNVADLARLLLDWESDRTRTEFVFAFHAAGDLRADDDATD